VQAGGAAADQGARQCLVCMDAPRCTRFFPCQHAVCCNTCAVLLLGTTRQCPVCASPIVTAGPTAVTEPTFVAPRQGGAPPGRPLDHRAAAVRNNPAPRFTLKRLAVLVAALGALVAFFNPNVHNRTVSTLVPLAHGERCSCAMLRADPRPCRACSPRRLCVGQPPNWTPLFAACSSGDAEAVRALLTAGAPVNQALVRIACEVDQRYLQPAWR
jgi:hypothetical protein